MTQETPTTGAPTAGEALAPAPFDPREFRNALGTFATGVTVVTAAGEDGRLLGMTVNSFAAVSLEPPLVLWSLVAHSPSAPAFLQCRHFAVNVLALGQRELSRTFSRPSPDKYAGIATRQGLGGAPLLEGAVAHFECQLERTLPGGDHVILLGRVLRFSHARAPTLIFCNGRYMRGHDLEPYADADAEIAKAWSGL
jgi:flavin reductase (DIM6/NTAB) family NADH-FMN oxidoreductase RutF